MERDKRADLAVSDYSQLGALREFLSWAVPGVRVLLNRGRPGRDEQVAPDILALLASTSAMVSAVRILPEFLRSRQAALSITITVRDKSIVLTATNVDDVVPILERLLEALLGDRGSPVRPRDQAEGMTGGVGIDIAAIQWRGAERQHARSSRLHVVHHDVEVNLLRHRRVRPGGRAVVRRELEGQARGAVVDGDDDPVAAGVRDGQPEQSGVERRQRRGIRAVKHHMMHPADHDYSLPW
jgi:hypothetical protein